MKISPKLLAGLIFVVGLMAIAYQVYELKRFHSEMWALKSHPATSTRQDKPASGLALAKLAKEHLMGSPAVQAAKPAAQAGVADPHLKLELVGTIRGGSADKDSALMQAKGKETKRYFVGERVEGGAVLDAVNEDSVILKRNGVLETLRYSNNESAPAPVQPVATNNASTAPPNPGAPVSTDKKPGDKAQAPLSLRERLRRQNK